MRRFLTSLIAVAVCSLAGADQTRLSLYLLGSKVGSSSYASRSDTLDGVAVKRTDATTRLDAQLLGQSLSIHVDSTSWVSSEGRPIKMSFLMESAGRTQKLEADFGLTEATVHIDNSGSKSIKKLAIPKDAPIVDDPLTEMLNDKTAIGAKKAFFVLDPTTVSFIRNEATFKGASNAQVFGKPVAARLIEIVDPRATLNVFVDEKGDLVKADGPMGIEMIPEAAEKANATPPPTTPIDLAKISSIGTDVPIEDADHLSDLRLEVIGHDMSKVPSDDHQTTRKNMDGWIVDVHPPMLSVTPGLTISEANAEQSRWTKPSMDLPSDTPEFAALARKIVGNRKRVRDASLAIRKYVHATMHPNAGIGVVRNASEVLATKEGVCRDYAVLTATLLRAAGIPARVASGLEAFRGRFYYHAWAEAWDGKRWIGIDSTVPEDQISAGHVKLAGGSVEDAFTFPVLDKVTIKVLAQTHAAGP